MRSANCKTAHHALPTECCPKHKLDKIGLIVLSPKCCSLCFRKISPSRSVPVIQPIAFLQPTVQLESVPSAVCHSNNPGEEGEKSLTVTQNKHPLIHSAAIQCVCLEIQNTLLLVDLFITRAISSLYVSVATLQMAIAENQKRER
jgi:hypothetical protein